MTNISSRTTHGVEKSIWSTEIPTKPGDYWFLRREYWRVPYEVIRFSIDRNADGEMIVVREYGSDENVKFKCARLDGEWSKAAATEINGVLAFYEPPILEWLWHGNANKSKGRYVAQLGAFYDGDGVLFSYKQLHRDDRVPSIASRIDSYQVTVQVSETRNGRKWFLDPSLTQRKVFIDIEEYFAEGSVRNESEALASILLKQRAANDDK